MTTDSEFVDYLAIPMGRLDHPDLSFIWIGSKKDACSMDELKSNSIHFIVNCTRDPLEGGVKHFHEKEPGFRYYRVPLKDNDTELLNLCVLQDTWKFIRRAKETDHGCLIHCAMGKSRSSAVLISYIMHVLGLSYDDALSMVRKARNVAEPNPAFADQLRYFYLSGDIRRPD